MIGFTRVLVIGCVIALAGACHSERRMTLVLGGRWEASVALSDDLYTKIVPQPLANYSNGEFLVLDENYASISLLVGRGRIFSAPAVVADFMVREHFVSEGFARIVSPFPNGPIAAWWWSDRMLRMGWMPTDAGSFTSEAWRECRLGPPEPRAPPVFFEDGPEPWRFPTWQVWWHPWGARLKVVFACVRDSPTVFVSFGFCFEPTFGKPLGIRCQ